MIHPELWQRLLNLDRDLLDPETPREVLDDAAARLGIDPGELREGAALVAALLRQRDEERGA